MTTRKISRQDLAEAAEKYKNWGKWGADDEVGTLNYTTPEDIVAAIAQQIGAVGIRVEKPSDFPAALAKGLAANRPVVIDVVTDIECLAPLAVS